MTKVQVNSQGKVYVAGGKALLAKNFGTKSITENGTYTASSDSLDGYSSVTVDVASSGGTKYGASIDNILGDVNANGVLQRPTEECNLVFTGVKDVADSGLQYCLYHQDTIKTITFPDLTEVSGNQAFMSGFYNCTNLTSVSFPELTTLPKTFTFYNAFGNCTALTSISFPKLREITSTDTSSYVFNSAFSGCTSLTSVSFPELTTINGGAVLSQAFRNCKSLTSVSFPKLITVPNNSAFGGSSSQYIFYGCTALQEIHFNSSAQSTIQRLTGYSAKWGASNATIYFDL